MMAVASKRNSLSAKGRRLWALVRKESRQVLRDPSSIAIGIVLPVVLILLFGYGLSLDVDQCARGRGVGRSLARRHRVGR